MGRELKRRIERLERRKRTKKTREWDAVVVRGKGLGLVLGLRRGVVMVVRCW